MPSEFELLELQKTSGVLYAIASFLIIFIANWSQTLLLQQQTEGNSIPKNNHPTKITPSQLTLITFFIVIIASSLSLFTARERLRQRQINQASGRDTTSLSPNILTTLGITLSFIGIITSALGAKERVEEEAQITS